MDSFFNFQFGEFTGVKPNWFDYLSLIITILGVVFGVLSAYLVARYTYNKEKRYAEKTRKEISEQQCLFFVENLKRLDDNLTKQIEELRKCREKDIFRLSVINGITSTFLQGIDLSNLFEWFDVQDKSRINKLLFDIYGLEDFKQSLQQRYLEFNRKYNYYERQFKVYREILYYNYFKLVNLRAENIEQQKEKVSYSFYDTDSFMYKYAQIRKNYLEKQGKENTDRELLVQEFLLPLIEAASEYVPSDVFAIEVHNTANESNSAYVDMLATVDVLKRELKAQEDTLVEINKDIKFLLES